ncbi:endonuclease/exonuclease/phosphatase family protein [Microbacterium sp. NPDC055312]
MTVATPEPDEPADALVGPREAPDVHVMTFNIRRAADGVLRRRADRWSWRAPAVRELLASERPTLIGLQEAMPRVMPLVREALGPDHRAIGAGRGSGGRGEGTPILFDRTHLELRDWGQRALSDAPERAGSIGWGNLIPRILVWAEFVERRTGTRFVAINTHLDPVSAGSRRRSALAIRRLVAERGLPAVVTGDLNAGADSTTVRALQTGRALVDAWGAAEGTNGPRWGTYPGYRRPRAGARQLDWILTTPDVRVRAVGINARTPGGRSPSDHLPVQAVLRFGEAAA